MSSEAASPQPQAGHPKIVAGLLLLGALPAFVAIFSIWAHCQALNVGAGSPLRKQTEGVD